MEHFPFPIGTQNKCITLHIDSLTDDLIEGALKFISKHGYHYTPTNKKKHIIVPRGCTSSVPDRTHSIEFESLFKEALDDGSDNMQHRDYYRYQTNPDSAPKLLECPEIKEILNRVQVCMNRQVNGYTPTKISFLYSLPGGKPQGWHQDDTRDEGRIITAGSLISAIVALENDTKLDVRNRKFERKTFIIPKGTMFVFDGKLVHGGSAYQKHNLRIHIYFMKMVDKGGSGEQSHNDSDNAIAHTYRCPVEGCPKCISKCNLTLSQMRNHWRMKHAAVENMGWKRYEASLKGNLHKCEQCGKTYLSVNGLNKHISQKHKRRRQQNADRRKRGKKN
jgi:hypothetical protein